MQLDISTSLESLFNRNDFGIYVHIPFCMRRCRYCAFVSSVPRQVPDEAYTQAVIREFDLRYADYDRFSLKTLYFGGGTPTMLADRCIDRILNHITKKCGIPVEMTIEANPEHLTPERCKSLLSLGFTRISLGIQSFDPQMLQFLGRRHDADTAKKAIDLLYQAGFDEISIDLIYGGLPRPDDSPKQAVARWRRDLEIARSCNPAHVSCYELTPEPHTPLSTCIKQGARVLCDDDTIAEMMAMIPDALGMVRYEISNYSRNHFFSAHNLSCWAGLPYLGLGAAAHSFNIAGDLFSRRANTRNIRQYMAVLNANPSKLPEPEFIETLSPQMHLGERLMCAARTRCRFCPQNIASQVGADISPYLPGITKALQQELLEPLPGDLVRTTQKGMMLNNILDALLFEGYPATENLQSD